ncbi:hypothetical protein BDQ12DRAFT_686962 [Crucibulum laeve]|uniref:MARVEL domain-containing protein n=1 Tax=Crucibulum laeve TaxID=68775 RepID=A0A5C3LSQ7_9AGAR|nr:hypothetical protein BDQ12DRAFT_686962 [Crucibulum laeve]
MTDAASTSGSGDQPRFTWKRFLGALRDCRTYYGFSLFFAILNLILAIMLLSRVPAKIESLLFGLTVLGTILAFAHFVTLCLLLQRRMEQRYGKYPRDPTIKDIACALGVAGLFILSGICLTVVLPSRCYSGDNEHRALLGKLTCNLFTTMSAFSWFGTLLMLIASVTIFLDIREANELAKQPPPVFPAGANPMVMKWLSRSDTLASVGDVERQ